MRSPPRRGVGARPCLLYRPPTIHEHNRMCPNANGTPHTAYLRVACHLSLSLSSLSSILSFSPFFPLFFVLIADTYTLFALLFSNQLLTRLPDGGKGGRKKRRKKRKDIYKREISKLLPLQLDPLWDPNFFARKSVSSSSLVFNDSILAKYDTTLFFFFFLLDDRFSKRRNKRYVSAEKQSTTYSL